jgi:hypothetical protein
LSDKLAASFKESGIYSKAYKYFFKSRNEKEVCECMDKIMQSGYESEIDLFVVRAALDMMLKSNSLEKATYIRDHFAERLGESDLVNFYDFLMAAVQLGELDMIRQMANVDYAAVLKRDPSLYEKVNAVCEKNFQGQGIKKENPMQAMLKNMMGGGGGKGLFGI